MGWLSICYFHLGEEPWLNIDNVCDLLNPESGLSPEHGLNPETEQHETGILPQDIHKAKTGGVTALPQYMGTYGHYAFGNLTIGAYLVLYPEIYCISFSLHFSIKHTALIT